MIKPTQHNRVCAPIPDLAPNPKVNPNPKENSEPKTSPTPASPLAPAFALNSAPHSKTTPQPASSESTFALNSSPSNPKAFSLNPTPTQKQCQSQTQLTKREYQVLFLITTGKTNQQIALMLDISIETVKKYTISIFKKLCVKNRIQAAVKAVRENLVAFDKLIAYQTLENTTFETKFRSTK